MKVDQILLDLIRICPLKEIDTLDSQDIHKAYVGKDHILASWDTEILKEVNSRLFREFPDYSFMIIVGSRYGIGVISDKNDPLKFLQSYYLLTGVMIGNNNEKEQKFYGEISVLYDKNGKHLNVRPERVSKKIPRRIYEIVKNMLEEKFEIKRNETP